MTGSWSRNTTARALASSNGTVTIRITAVWLHGWVGRCPRGSRNFWGSCLAYEKRLLKLSSSAFVCFILFMKSSLFLTEHLIISCMWLHLISCRSNVLTRWQTFSTLCWWTNFQNVDQGSKLSSGLYLTARDNLATYTENLMSNTYFVSMTFIFCCQNETKDLTPIYFRRPQMHWYTYIFFKEQ